MTFNPTVLQLVILLVILSQWDLRSRATFPCPQPQKPPIPRHHQSFLRNVPADPSNKTPSTTFSKNRMEKFHVNEIQRCANTVQKECVIIACPSKSLLSLPCPNFLALRPKVPRGT